MNKQIMVYPDNGILFNLKKKLRAGHQRLMPIILATQEVEIRRITV
jgi:hypothetical protein